MKHFRSSIIFLFIIGLTVGLLGHSTPSAHAEGLDSSDINLITSCDTGDDASFTGELSTPADQYDVYARLPTEGQTATVHVYGDIQDGSDACTPIGSVDATGDKWTLVGTWDAPSDDIGSSVDTIFQLSSPDLSTALGANRPSIMLISQTNPTCQPTTECTVDIDGQTGFVRPIGTLPNQDSLHIVRPIDPTQDKVKLVTYYVDNEPVYTTPTLQPFDLRYVAHASQLQSRVIEYASGQRVVLNVTTPNDFGSNFADFIFRLVHANPRALITAGIGVLVAILGAVAVGVIHTIQRRRQWRIAHGLEQEQVRILTDADRRQEFVLEHRKAIIKRSIEGFVALVIVIGIILLVNTFIVKLYKVDGHSMDSTYNNGQHMLINEVPVTFAHIAGHDYTPKRGQVVIVREIFGVTDDIQPGLDLNKYLIKRVVGLPGERVTVHDGVIMIYNSTHPDGFDVDDGAKWQKTMHVDEGSEDVDLTLGNDELFIAGDNRPVSIDSRFNGPILTKQIIGLVK